MQCQYKDTKLPLQIHIVDTCAPPVLGLKACLDFKLIKLILSVSSTPGMSIMDEYADVFKGIGLFPGECTIHIDPSAVPVIHPPRRVPLALRDRLRDELSRTNFATNASVFRPFVCFRHHQGISQESLLFCLAPFPLVSSFQQPQKRTFLCG